MHRHRHGDSGALVIFFANITQFNDKACHWLMHNESQVCFAVETHWSPGCNQSGSKTIRDLACAGWEITIGEPQQSKASVRGTWGGVVGIARKHLDFQPLAGSAKMPTRVPRIRGSAWSAESPYLAGVQIGMQGWDLLLFGKYHMGWSGRICPHRRGQGHTRRPAAVCALRRLQRHAWVGSIG